MKGYRWLDLVLVYTKGCWTASIFLVKGSVCFQWIGGCTVCCLTTSKGQSVYTCSEWSHLKAGWKACCHCLLLADSRCLPDQLTTLCLLYISQCNESYKMGLQITYFQIEVVNNVRLSSSYHQLENQVQTFSRVPFHPCSTQQVIVHVRCVLTYWKYSIWFRRGVQEAGHYAKVCCGCNLVFLSFLRN